mmetsp:Transcript_114893/g.336098  ORF Transcript_114893/g.336098 Transcript_114893/m.336098 type:complete len:206 (+) Transcript_114893:131-748(+)
MNTAVIARAIAPAIITAFMLLPPFSSETGDSSRGAVLCCASLDGASVVAGLTDSTGGFITFGACLGSGTSALSAATLTGAGAFGGSGALGRPIDGLAAILTASVVFAGSGTFTGSGAFAVCGVALACCGAAFAGSGTLAGWDTLTGSGAFGAATLAGDAISGSEAFSAFARGRLVVLAMNSFSLERMLTQPVSGPSPVNLWYLRR